MVARCRGRRVYASRSVRPIQFGTRRATTDVRVRQTDRTHAQGQIVSSKENMRENKEILIIAIMYVYIDALR